MIVTGDMVPWIVGAAVAVFALGYAVGHALVKAASVEMIHINEENNDD